MATKPLAFVYTTRPIKLSNR